MHDRILKHTESHKLEDPERLNYLPPLEIVERLALTKGMKVADIGAGTGYFAIPIARAVGDSGHVFAVDLQPEMLEKLRRKLESEDAPTNISVHEGEASRLPLPDRSVDLIFFANVWHELPDLPAALREATRVLSDGGRIAIVDWRAELEPPPGPRQSHRIGADKVVKMLGTQGFQDASSAHVGRYSHIVMAERMK